LTSVQVRRVAWIAVATGIAYYIGARVGIALKPHGQPISTLWPPNAILLAGLLLTPVRAWPVIMAAVLPAHIASEIAGGAPMSLILSWFVSNCTEALIGAAGVRRFIALPIRFDSVRRVAIFVAIAVLFAPFVSSFLDVAFVQWNHWTLDHPAYWDLWRSRFFSNALANLTLVPVIVDWTTGRFTTLRSMGPRRLAEAAVLTFGLLVAGVVALWQQPSGVAAPVLLGLPLPFLLWAAIRFGPGGASAALFVFSLLSISGAVYGQGPFHGSSVSDYVFSLQLFLIITYIPFMALAAVICERRRAEEEARNTGDRLNMVLGAAQMGTWDFDVLANRGTFSKQSRQMFQLPDDADEVDWNGTFASRLSAEDAEAVRVTAARAIHGSAPYQIEYQVRRPDGSVRWVLSKGKVIHDDHGRAVRMLGVHVDVTEQRLAEEALRAEAALVERASRLRELADAMPQIVWTARADGQIDFFNERWYALTGMERGPVRDDHWTSALHPDDRDGCVGAWHAHVLARIPHEHEGRFWSAADNRYRWHLTRALPVFDPAGDVLRWYGTATDIDDRKRAEEALRRSELKLRGLGEVLEHRVAERTVELSRTNAVLRTEIEVRARVERALRASEERFAKAFRASPDAIAILRLAQGQIIEVNERWVAMFQFTRSEALGHTLEELGICTNDQDSRQFDVLLAANSFVRDFEMDVRNKQGDLLRAVVSAETVDMAGEACVITMVRDITERRRAEHEVTEQRRQLAHLGRVALLGELSGALAHELNQPLAAILANARAAQRMLNRDPLDVAELRNILEDIAADDRRAGSVIHRVRALLRKGDTEPQQVVANEVVIEVLELAHSDLIQRGVTATTRFASQLPSTAADRVQLQQVLLNLIVNACDAMTESPVAERRLSIETADEGSAVRISVSDTGTGITAVPVDAVFEPFITSKEHGLGLGLSICRSIVDAHGGRMWAENNSGCGATFHVLLPRTQVALEVPALSRRFDSAALAR